MAINHPKAGPNSVPAYQMSGIPFVTSSVVTEVPRADNADPTPIQVVFPFVTKNIKIRNIGENDLRVGFSALGVKTPGQGVKGGDLRRNYFVIPASGSANLAGSAGLGETIQTFDVRCKSIFFTAENGTTGFSLFAGLTTIDKDQFPILTGSVNGTTGFEGVG
jgi:hypothetical protein